MNPSPSPRPLARLFDLTGRVALVTGGAVPRFGAQVVSALAEAGAQVVLTSRDAAKAEEVAAGYREQGLKVAGTVLELADEGSIRHAVAATAGRFGRLDVLVNGAAVLCMEPVETVTAEAFNRALTANVTGTLLASRAAAEAMKPQGGGVIVNLSSIYGVVAPDPRIYGESGLNSPLVYGASKAAIEQMTRYLAIHWAPTIRVNAVTAGGLYAGQSDEFVRNYVQRTPLGRMAGLPGEGRARAPFFHCWGRISRGRVVPAAGAAGYRFNEGLAAAGVQRRPGAGPLRALDQWAATYGERST